MVRIDSEISTQYTKYTNSDRILYNSSRRNMPTAESDSTLQKSQDSNKITSFQQQIVKTQKISDNDFENGLRSPVQEADIQAYSTSGAASKLFEATKYSFRYLQ